MIRRVVLPTVASAREFIGEALGGQSYQCFYGGARGTGKTNTLSRTLLLRAADHEHSYHIMMRRVRAAGEMTLGREVQRELLKLGLSVGNRAGQVVYSKDNGRFTLPNGSVLALGYCKTNDDWQQYQGGEYATVAWDEVTQFPEDPYDRVNASCRSGRANMHAVVLAAGNPGGPGHEWVRRRFIYPETRDRRTYVVRATLKDNPAMTDIDPGYAMRVLRKLPPSLRAMWERGDWAAVEGAFFTMPDGFWQVVDVPEWAQAYAGVDAGYWPSAFAAVWVAMWRDDAGRRRIHIMRDLKRHKLDAASQAVEALMEEAALPIPVRGRYADPQAWMRTERSNLEGAANTAMIWAQNHWTVAAAPKSPRADGWMALRTMIADGTLTADPRCRALRSELEGAMHDWKTDDIAGDCDDHVLDALRYWVNTMVVAHGSKPMTPDDLARRRAKRLTRRPTQVWAGSGRARRIA